MLTVCFVLPHLTSVNLLGLRVTMIVSNAGDGYTKIFFTSMYFVFKLLSYVTWPNEFAFTLAL